MSQRGQLLAAGESYHVYNRGAHKEKIFRSNEDRDRFLLLLYLLNTEEPILMRGIVNKYRGRSSAEVFLEEESNKTLVDVLGYSLMPNHFHLILRQKADEGIEKFMRKVSTAYSMYFNLLHNHSGTLFQGRYKSIHIDNEAYFRYIFAYVHLNPLELFQSDWKEVGIKKTKQMRDSLSTYKYSSYADYPSSMRPESKILCYEDMPDFLAEQNDLDELIKWESVISAEVGPLQLSTGIAEDRPR